MKKELLEQIAHEYLLIYGEKLTVNNASIRVWSSYLQDYDDDLIRYVASLLVCEIPERMPRLGDFIRECGFEEESRMDGIEAKIKEIGG